MNKNQIKILIPMIILIISIVIGFSLLAMVYHGNNVIESVVIVVVILILVALVKITKSLVKGFSTLDDKK